MALSEAEEEKVAATKFGGYAANKQKEQKRQNQINDFGE
jgi:hypothetical protein